MRRVVTLLAALAGAQALVLGGLLMLGDLEQTPTRRPLLELDAADVQRVRIRSGGGDEGTEVVLVRDGSGWKLENTSGLAADPAKVDQVIQPLLAAQVREPVATSPSSHESLGLNEERLSRRIALTSDAGTTELVLGPGKKAHVRVDDDPTAWQLQGVTAWEIDARPVDYLVSPYLSVDVDTIVALQLGTHLRLEREPDGPWTLLPPPDEGRVVDQEAADTLVGRLGAIRLDGLPEDPLANVAGMRVDWWTARGDEPAGSFVIEAPEGAFQAIASPSQGYAGTIEQRYGAAWFLASRESLTRPVMQDTDAP